MSDTIGKDGLTHTERVFRNTIDGLTRVAQAIGAESPFDAAAHAIVEALAAERLTHAETRARAETAEAERDRLRAALEMVSLRQEPDGPCWCVFPIPKGSAHHITCARARALLGEVKP